MVYSEPWAAEFEEEIRDALPVEEGRIVRLYARLCGMKGWLVYAVELSVSVRV